jgi:hypothetical protein
MPLFFNGEIDEQALVDCWGTIKVSQTLVRGNLVLKLEGFAST